MSDYPTSLERYPFARFNLRQREVLMVKSAQLAKITDCPSRPPCPACRMNMITTKRIDDGRGFEHCEFRCLRCGHVEVSKPSRH